MSVIAGTANKGKAIPVHAWTCREGFRRFRLPDFKTAHETGKDVSPTHQLPLCPRKYSRYLFLLSVAGRIMSMKNSSDAIGY